MWQITDSNKVLHSGTESQMVAAFHTMTMTKAEQNECSFPPDQQEELSKIYKKVKTEIQLRNPAGEIKARSL